MYRAETEEIPRIFQVGGSFLSRSRLWIFKFTSDLVPSSAFTSHVEIFSFPDESLLFSVCFQILYANEGECRKEAEMETVPQGDKTNCLPHKGHEFIPTLYHFPSNCEACAKPLWHVFKPPPALECRRCHVKCHKDHLDKKEDVIAPCKGNLTRSFVLINLSCDVMMDEESFSLSFTCNYEALILT